MKILAVIQLGICAALSAQTPSASIEAVPAKPVFTLSNTTLTLYSKAEINVAGVRVVAFQDEGTGTPEATVPFDDLTPGAAESKIPANDFQSFKLALRKDFKPRARSYSGQLAVRYTPTAGKEPPHYVLIAFIFQGPGFSPSLDRPREATLTISTPAFHGLIGSVKSLRFCPTTSKGIVTVEEISTSLTDTATKQPLDGQALQFASSLPHQLHPDRPECFTAQIPDTLLRDSNGAAGTVTVRYRPAVGGAANAATWSFDLVRVAREVKVGAAQEIRLQFIRSSPFQTGPFCDDIHYRSSLGGPRLPDNTSYALFVETDFGTSAVHLVNHSLRATATVLPDSNLKFCATIPSGLTQARAYFRLEPPATSTSTEIKVVFLLKDPAWLRLVVLVVFYILALLLTFGLTHARQNFFYKQRLRDLESRLEKFLIRNPPYRSDVSVDFVRRLLKTSSQQAAAGDFDSASTSLQDAETRIDALIALENQNPVPGPITAGKSLDAIRVIEPPVRQHEGRTLSLTIDHFAPGWTNTPDLTWKIDGNTVAQGQRTIQYYFPKNGEYAVTVEAAGSSQILSRTLKIRRRPFLDRTTRFLRLLDWAPACLAALIAAAAAYAATNVANWGTLGDYIGLAAAAFGITGGVQAVATVIAQLRTR